MRNQPIQLLNIQEETN